MKKIFKIMAIISAFVFLISACALDSETIIPVVVAFISLAMCGVCGLVANYLKGGSDAFN